MMLKANLGAPFYIEAKEQQEKQNENPSPM